MAKRSHHPKFRGFSEAKEPSYEVGYGKPPVHTQFQPGRSGNPRSRPRRAKNIAQKSPAENEERMKTFVLEEAYRMIGVRDGDRIVEIPTIQAILRSIALNAAKGNQRSQRMFADLVLSIEGEKKALYDEFLKTTIEYKAGWDLELARREKFGETGPEPVPHPDDIIVNLETGGVQFRGPMTKEEKVVWDLLRRFNAEPDESTPEPEENAAKAPDERSNKKEIEN